MTLASQIKDFKARFYARAALVAFLALARFIDCSPALAGNTGSTLDTNGNIEFSIYPSGSDTPGIVKLTTDGGVTTSGNVGVGMTMPGVSLDVNGGIRPGSSTAVTACGVGQANGEGTQRYNYTTHGMEYCNGTTWISMTSPNLFVMRYHIDGAPWGCAVSNPITADCTCAPGTNGATAGETGFGFFESPWDAYFVMTTCQ